MRGSSLRLAVLLLLVGLGAALVPTTARATALEGALLSTTDLPAGWTVLSESAAPPSSYAWCPGGAALPVAPVERVARSFAGGSPGPLVYHAVWRFRPGEATAALAAVRASPGACAWTDDEADLAPMTFSLTALTEWNVGEEAVHRRLVASWDEMVVVADVVLIRHGGDVAILTHLAIGQREAPLDAALTEQLARQAADRLVRGAGSGR